MRAHRYVVVSFLAPAASINSAPLLRRRHKDSVPADRDIAIAGLVGGKNKESALSELVFTLCAHVLMPDLRV